MRLHRFRFKKFSLKPLAFVLILAFSNLSTISSAAFATSESFLTDPNFACTNIKVVYARESGAELGSLNYERFTEAFFGVFGDDEPSISVYELGTHPGGYDGSSYPSPGIGIETWARFKTTIGAYVSAGETYSYGESVKEGAREAVYFIKNYKKVCPNSKVVMAGYSQGAQVVSLSLQSLDPSLVFSALTFGDPKLFLPEGRFNAFTASTPACDQGRAVYSPYRANVPDCFAYQGILGGYVPYQPSSGYDGKLKAYCQYHDVICSAYVDPARWYSGHASYKESGAYVAASKDVYNQYFGIENSVPERNVAILFDVSSSMTSMIGKFKNDAIKTAEKVFSQGGKVALYTYSDLRERDVEKLCDFSTCTAESVSDLINAITLEGGGDDPESMLSASYKLMKELRWSAGANKSVFVITDAGFHDPDHDGITSEDVLNLSYEIDPVSIFVLTEPESAGSYAELTSRTNGAVYTSVDDDAVLKFDVASESADPTTAINSGTPTISEVSNLLLEPSGPSSLKLSFENSGPYAILTINEDVVGVMDTNFLEIADVDFSRDTTVCLAPVSDTNFRGETICSTYSRNPESIVIPKAPNTGRH